MALENYIIFHNQTKKYSTKYAPYEIRDIDDKNLIDIVLNNMVKNFKKHIIKENEILDMNDKILLLNNLKEIIFKTKIIKIKKVIMYILVFSKFIPILIL